LCDVASAIAAARGLAGDLHAVDDLLGAAPVCAGVGAHDQLETIHRQRALEHLALHRDVFPSMPRMRPSRTTMVASAIELPRPSSAAAPRMVVAPGCALASNATPRSTTANTAIFPVPMAGSISCQLSALSFRRLV